MCEKIKIKSEGSAQSASRGGDRERTIIIDISMLILRATIRKISKYKYLHTIIIDESMYETQNVVCALERVVETSKFLRLFCSRLCHIVEHTVKCGKLKHLRYLKLQKISPEGMCAVTKLYHFDAILPQHYWFLGRGHSSAECYISGSLIACDMYRMDILICLFLKTNEDLVNSLLSYSIVLRS